MLTVAIRELDGAVLASAAEQHQVIGLTNDRRLAGVLIPVSRAWVENLVESNLSRVVQSVQRGERELASAARSLSLVDGGAPQLTTLDDVLGGSMSPGGGPRLRRVSLRDVDGTLIDEAAERQEALGITNNRVLAGVLVPVSRRWVEQLVDQNLSRILYNLEAGEKEMATGDLVHLDSVVEAAQTQHEGSASAT